MFKRKFPPEVYDYIKAHKTDSAPEIKRELKKRFGVDMSVSGVAFYFHPEYAENAKAARKGKYKPSFLLKPVGSERVDKDGYIRVITSEGKERLKHHIVWEQETGKKVGRDEVIIFLNNDRTDCRIENLYCIKRKYLGALNWRHYRELPFETLKLALNATILRIEAAEKEIKMRNQGNRSVIHKGNTIFVDYIKGYLDGKNVREIAREWGRSDTTVRFSLYKWKNGGYDKWLDQMGLGNMKPKN